MKFLSASWPIIVIGLMVGAQCVIFTRKGDYWMALVYFGYVLSNVGLTMVAVRG